MKKKIKVESKYLEVQLDIKSFKEANNWAKENNKVKFSVLNNNLALCKMIKPLWDGCISSNDQEILTYLESTKTAHLSWSSQGRGYFLPDDITHQIEEKITKDESSWRQPGEHSSGPLSCFDNEDNRERKSRAIDLAKNSILTHRILQGLGHNLDFPSFALIGPRIISEID